MEYKRNRDQNVISQGLSYLWWLHDHHHEFESLAREKIGTRSAGEIDWSAPRIVCVAGAFTHHDTVAVEMIGHRIDLVTYRAFEDVLTLRLIASADGTRNSPRGGTSRSVRAASAAPKSVRHYLDESPKDLKELYADLDELLLSHPGVRKEPQLHYIAYRRINNVATVRLQPRNRLLVVNLKVEPDTVELHDGFSRDMRGVGVLGIRGGVEVRIGSREDLVRATDLIQRSIDAG
ncbi:transporter [Streptomyces sp. NPDC102462]|uniref:transporter n=1 Tax=Streptomyces sp. NPDC102462 TaxID=3366178 RepID=UPI0037F84001